MQEVSLKEKITGNALVIGFTELAMMLGGMRLMNLAYGPIFRLPYFVELSKINRELYLTLFYTIAMTFFLIPIGLCLLYMYFADRRTLRVFAEGGFKKCLAALAGGFLIGSVLNAAVSLLVVLTGSVKLTFSGFTWRMLPMLPAMLISAVCEEVLLRGYVVQFARKRNSWSAAAFMSGALFIFHHVNNMKQSGFDPIFALVIFLFGILMYLMLEVGGNFWICCGFHTAWNYMQSLVFGLPCSGAVFPGTLFCGTDARDSFFYNAAYGNDGSLLSAVVIAALCLPLLWRFLKTGGDRVNEIVK